MMRLPFILRRPMAGGDEDRQLVESLWQRRLEARGSAELLAEVADLGAAQQHVERTIHATARSGNQMLDHRLLSRRHLVVGERFETVATQLNRARVGPLCGRLRDHGSNKGNYGGGSGKQSNHGRDPFARMILPPQVSGIRFQGWSRARAPDT